MYHFDASQARDHRGRWTRGAAAALTRTLRGLQPHESSHIGQIVVRRHGSRYAVHEPRRTPVKFQTAEQAAGHVLTITPQEYIPDMPSILGAMLKRPLPPLPLADDVAL